MKIDLSKSTFIIPIRLETDDRVRNAITSLCFLLSNFKTNIVVKEVDSSSVFLDQVLPQIEEFCEDISDLKHIFEQSQSPEFHRQRILNDMILQSTTEIVVNYDCDILLPVQSYVNAYNLILDGSSDVVYPYGDGMYQKQVFADDELVSDFLNSDFEFSILESKSRDYDAKYGFCQFFNRKVYIDGGLENENFVSYAPEDVERFYRFNILGYKLSRINDKVYHLEHKRTPNSYFTNPHMQSNNAEWEKIKTMSRDDIVEYYKNQTYYIKRMNSQSKITYINYSDANYQEHREFLIKHVTDNEIFDFTRTFTREWLETTDFYTQNKSILNKDRLSGYALWKPFILLKALDDVEYGDIVAYMDCGDIPLKGIKECIIEYMKDYDQYFVSQNHTGVNKWFTKRDCFYYMGCDEEKYWNSIQLEDGFLAFRKTQKNIDFLNEWLEYCRDERVVTDIPNQCGLENFDGFIDHRHDQSIITNLQLKYNLPCVMGHTGVRHYIHWNVLEHKDGVEYSNGVYSWGESGCIV